MSECGGQTDQQVAWIHTPTPGVRDLTPSCFIGEREMAGDSASSGNSVCPVQGEPCRCLSSELQGYGDGSQMAREALARVSLSHDTGPQLGQDVSAGGLCVLLLGLLL